MEVTRSVTDGRTKRAVPAQPPPYAQHRDPIQSIAAETARRTGETALSPVRSSASLAFRPQA